MHGLTPFAAALLLVTPVAALELPETSISYTVEVSLDPATRMLDGRETVRWTNPSSAPIEAVPMHLYLNAFAHEETTWMRGVPPGRFDVEQMLRRYPDPWGWNEPVSILRDGVELDWRPIAPDDGNPLDRSLIEVALDRPLPPGEVLELEIEFDARLPIPIARTGGREDYFLVSQWFPKIAMFETVGVRGATEDRWNAHQFHGPTEFYAEYADFDVRIGIPAGWGIVSSGVGQQDGEETDGIAWHRYRQRAVHDFAFSVGERMVAVSSTHDPRGAGGPVTIHIFLPQATKHQAERWTHVAKAGLDVMGERVGPYPYESLSVIFAPWWADETLGMEYPTLITGGPGDPLWDTGLFSSLKMGEYVTAHEFAHQYFYGLVGTNEFEEAYMDEGFTEYWGNRIMIAAYGEEATAGSILGRGIPASAIETMGLPSDRTLPQSIWSGDSYLARNGYKFAQFYNIPALTMMTAEGLFGIESVDRVFAEYYRRWAFRHPRFEDFLDVARETGGDAFADFVLESYTTKRQPDYHIVTMESEVWKRPRGRLVTPDGVIEPDAEDEDEIELAGLDPVAQETDGLVLAEVHDPGRSRGEPGGIERRSFEPEQVDPDEDWETEEDVFHESRVRVAGPGWTRLPVEIHFRFADGTLVREHWDGRADYRLYRFVRGAPLSEVHIDPDAIVLLDPDRANNARTREPDRTLTGDWSSWLGGVFQLLFEGMGQWL